ncbi:MAG: hypothetical protein M1812_006974 [Candelaria pacifica]|nr:MAG: hypothetical protein M1812_006974 [Candelaria pacifica]
MNNSAAVSYLESLIGKQLRITTTDTRMFVGTMKCTDHERNIILALTHEYRHPPAASVAAVATTSSSMGNIKLDMTSRFLGLVVVPGQYITRIEVEEYPAQEQQRGII